MPRLGATTTTLTSTARAVMERHLHRDGYTVPSALVYPWQWLWDSAFHAIAWNALDRPDRALVELDTLLGCQRRDGFVPHIRYHGPSPHADFWKLPDTSAITQPPMYGHAIARLHRAGVDIPTGLLERARQGFDFLLRHRARVDGLVSVVHPWETGADNSPRWDHWVDGHFSLDRWWVVKGELVRSIMPSDAGAPISNSAFACAPAGFNALVAFNALELAWVTDDEHLQRDALEIVDRLDVSWSAEAGTWVDVGDSGHGSGRVRTLDALLPLLVSRRPVAVRSAIDQLLDPCAFAATYGPTGVHRAEEVFRPDQYWRGSAWPQLTYLLWWAARNRGEARLEESLRTSARRGAARSRMAEHWHPDDGTGLGAVPQSWSALVVAMA
ncbi:MAG: hypothetical protein JJE52_06365 [Acidimicrobiia bacterium]|nr:hypothetical protein [Acidimicrobiia bacterium]